MWPPATSNDEYGRFIGGGSHIRYLQEDPVLRKNQQLERQKLDVDRTSKEYGNFLSRSSRGMLYIITFGIKSHFIKLYLPKMDY